jgi:pimeloyl-ACP methyl ester carboxylesterase
MLMESKIYDPTDHSAFGKGDPLVLLPDLYAGSWIWDKAIPHFLAGGYRVIAPQHPLAAFAGTLASIEDLRRLLVQFFTYVEIDRAILVGSGFGGFLAIDFARVYPHRVRSLVVSGVPGLGETAPAPTAPEREVERETRARRRGGWNLDAILKSASDHSLPDALCQLACPTLLLWGADDRETPLVEWRTAVEIVPSGRLAVLEECGHRPMLEKPMEFGRAALRFLQESLVLR